MVNWAEIFEQDNNGIYTNHIDKLNCAQSLKYNHLSSDIDYEKVSELVANVSNKSSYSLEYQTIINSNVSINHLYAPEAANNLRGLSSVLPYHKHKNVLSLGSLSTTSMRYLAETTPSLTIVDFNYNRLRLVKDRCSDLTNVQYIFSDLTNIDEWSTFDLVVCEGSSDFANIWQYANQVSESVSRLPYQSHLSFAQKALSLVNEQGTLMMIADNLVGEKYLLGVTDERAFKANKCMTGFHYNDMTSAITSSQWRQIFSTLHTQPQEYYAFPDYRFTEVILGRSYVESNVDAWQHLDRIHAKDHLSYQTLGAQEPLFLSALSKQYSLGLFANSINFIVDKASIHRKVLDFMHLPRFERQANYLHRVQKFADDSHVERVTELNQTLVDEEPFVAGKMLSLAWIEALLNTSSDQGLDKFNQQLQLYFQFLQSLTIAQGFNIDCVPNNIIIDEHGDYQVIDKEWQEKFSCTAELVFYRGIWMFVHRYQHLIAPHLYKINVRTLREFLYYAFYQAGSHLNELLIDSYYRQDNEFLTAVSGKSSRYDLDYDLTIKDSHRIDSNPMKIQYRYHSNICENDIENVEWLSGQVEQEVFHSDCLQTVVFTLPDNIAAIDELVFWPYLFNDHQACFDIRSIKLMAQTKDTQTEEVSSQVIWASPTQEKIIKDNLSANTPFITKDNKPLIFLTSVFDNLKFHLDNVSVDKYSQLIVKCTFIYDLHPVYKMIKDDFINEQRALSANQINAIEASQKRIDEVVLSHQQIEAELNEIKQSRIWKIVRCYSDVFKVDNYPTKNLFQKCIAFMKAIKHVIKP